MNQSNNIIALGFKGVFSFHKSKLYLSSIVTALIALLLAFLLVTSITGSVSWFANSLPSWLDVLVSSLTAGISTFAAWFMLPTLAILAVGFMQDRIIQRIEKNEYGNTVKSNDSTLSDLIQDIRFTLWAIFLNICILPLYFIGIGFLVSILLNGYLLGNEFFQSITTFYKTKKEAKLIAKKHRLNLLLFGVSISALMLIPVLNLFIPVLAVNIMVHYYKAHIEHI